MTLPAFNPDSTGSTGPPFVHRLAPPVMVLAVIVLSAGCRDGDHAGPVVRGMLVDTLPLASTAITGGVVPCRYGRAAGFDCDGMTLVSFLPRADIGAMGGFVNDVWGWTDPETGNEWALVGHFRGTSFIDLSDPENPVYTGVLPLTGTARESVWRDIKVYRGHAFVVADGAGDHGVQVLPLDRLREVTSIPAIFAPAAVYDRVRSAHNIVVNEESGFAYVVGANGGRDNCGGGLHMIDIRDPVNPSFAGCFADDKTGIFRSGYTHDAQCVIYRGPDTTYRGREICFGANETHLSIADVTDRQSPVALAAATYPLVGYAHQGWLDEDHAYFYMNDELDEVGGVRRTRTLVWDVGDLEDPVVARSSLAATRSTDHNLYVSGDLLYQSNYTSGLRILDISNREYPREVAFFDTEPFRSDSDQVGSWSNYPYFRSGVIAVTSMEKGIFFLRKQP